MKSEWMDQQKKDKKRKEFLIFRDKYRLKHPFFNLVYDQSPILSGVVVGFISSLIWVIIFDEYMPKVFTYTFVTGCIGGLIAKLTHKWFEDEAKIKGFEDQPTGKDWNDEKILNTNYSKYKDL